MDKTPWRMLFWLLVTQVMVAFVGRCIGPLAPFMEESFNLSKAQVGLLPAALFVGQSIVSILAGWYADVLGTRKMLLILSGVLCLGYLVASLSPWYFLSLFFILIGGLGYGAMHPTSSRGIIYWFPSKVAGTAMGIKQMGVTGGSALAALLLIPLSLSIGWRLAIGSAVLLLAMIAGLSFLFYRDAPDEKETAKVKPNFKETLKQLLKHKPFLIISFAAMGLSGAQISVSTYMVIFASQSLQYSLVIAGSFLALYEIGGSVGRIGWGVISDRIFSGKRVPVLIAIATITAIISIILSALPEAPSKWFLILIIFIMGFCVAGFNGIWMNFAAESVEKRFSGLASGLSLGIGSLGVVIGPPLFGAMVDWTGTFSMSWLFIFMEMLVVIPFLWWAGRKEKESKNQPSYERVETL